MKPVSEDLGDSFDGSVLEGNGPEILCPSGIIFFWKENKVGSVDAFELSKVAMKGMEQGKDIRRCKSPSRFKEKGTKTIRAGIRMHTVESMVDL